MSDLTIPGTLATALLAAGAAMWKRIDFVERRERAESEKRLKEERERCDSHISAFEARLAKVEKHSEDCEESLRREIRRGAELAWENRVPSEPLPEPEWSENTARHNVRQLIEQQVRERALERYVKGESTPPKLQNPRAQVDLLIIDDEESSASSLHRVLRGMVPNDWTIEHTTDPIVGRSLLVLDPRVKVAFVDYRMDGLNGEAVIREALGARPELRGKIILCSGMILDHEQQRRMFGELGCLWLGKPFSLEELEHILWTALDKPKPPRPKLPSRPK
jgi:CheY-like chemotaxis protein